MIGGVKISVCIITGNEEKNITRCLESVKWADEIIVVDSFSTDKTVEICKKHTNMVFQHRWLGYIGQKTIARNLATNEWILFIDADEVISEILRKEIETTFSEGVPAEISGFAFPRQVRFLNRWIRHGDWYPDFKLRLFRKNRGKCCGIEPHERIDVTGGIRHLKGPLYHYTYDNISDQVTTLNRFSTISANGRKISRFRLFSGMFLNSPFRFFRCYIIKLGFLDGIAGFIIAVISSYGTFLKYAKLWESRISASGD